MCPFLHESNRQYLLGGLWLLGKQSFQSNLTLHHLDAHSDIIDTPGVQAFGVHHLGVDGLAAAFLEFRSHLGQCRFRDCRHLEEPDCAIIAAQEAGHIEARRLASYRRLAQDILRQQKRY